ncbi:phosphate--AMP phosphotransferase [Desulforamulus ruminis]|uniref:Polyphosphate kinase-2-related domain-containing protein n=1 Tax=Desulforamulus ruminis (strain ATCC 23193 / DSM 2154 / NCIMB 8452 / DL) TaxID=696281 RepID=F6DL55_DESRL|nr:hypothetical protein [Desulforamulus ruminis]AEG59276.1 protein of unknown function DUF344 [Desulforamulus ruminis DSM 2154]
MLEEVNLNQKMDKEDFKKLFSPLEMKLAELQRRIRELKIPVMVVFEGWDAAGKGTLINQMIQALDPRGFHVYSIQEPTEEERLYPFLWRFWIKTPAQGRIAVFDRSWYRRTLIDRVEKVVAKKEWQQSYEEINVFERQLTDSGCLIVKFFLHISQKEQKARLEELAENPATAWRVTERDWKHHRQYGLYQKAANEMLEKTNTRHAPWTVVEAHHQRFATIKIYSTLVKAIEDAVHLRQSLSRGSGEMTKGGESLPKAAKAGLLEVNLKLSLDQETYREQLKKYQKKIREIEHALYLKRLPLVILYEGWDAAGKGGNIRRVTEKMDPRGYRVVPVAIPNDLEKAHHYLWRFWNYLPKAGHITIFDRSWYGRVLVERVENYCTRSEWQRAYREINEMEEYLVGAGVLLVKFWLHIEQEEQLKRFIERQQRKPWKITEEDWRNRDKWPLYLEAVEEMLQRTSTSHAPWTLVEANSKYYARIKTMKTIIEAVEKRL